MWLVAWPPSSDSFSWITWARELGDPHAPPLIIAGGPSWKPFPVLFTAIFGLVGHAGPAPWLALVRTAGLLALVGAYCLGRRFGGRVAGVLAAAGLLLLHNFFGYVARGASEPIVIAAVLWALELHLGGRPRAAYVLGVVAALNRPELALFVAFDAVYLWRRVPRSRPLAIVGLALIPIAWLVPPWIDVGNPFQPGKAAAHGLGGESTWYGLIGTAPGLLTPPLLVLAGLGIAMAVRLRNRQILGLSALAVGVILISAVSAEISFSTERYLLPAAAIGCVIAAVGVVRISELAGASGGGRSLALAVGTVIVLLTLPWTIPRAAAITGQVRDANLAGRLLSDLFTAIDRAGGRRVVVPCGKSSVAVNHSVASAVAWKLNLPLTRSRGILHGTGYAFIHPKTIPTGSPPIIASPRHYQLVAQHGGWQIYEVTRIGAPLTPRCLRRAAGTATPR